MQVAIPFKVPVERKSHEETQAKENVATFSKVISASAVSLVHSSLGC